MPQIHRYIDEEPWARAAAAFVADAAAEGLRERSRFSLVLSGGGTPRPVYERLPGAMGAAGVEWGSVHIFWGDERCVSPEHPASNYRMASEAFLAEAPIPEANLHRLACERDPEQGAAAYEELLRSYFEPESEPRFDLILLGLGADAHTASLFPGSVLLEERERWVAAAYVEALDSWRATLTPPAINAARRVAFLVRGEGKAEVVRKVVKGSRNPRRWPAQLVQPRTGELHWFLDEAAASQL